MKKLITSLIALCLSVIACPAYADDAHYGFSVVAGVPSGAGVGFVMQPWTRLARLEVALNQNLATFGGSASATFTPFKLPISPVLFAEAGFFPQASIPSCLSKGTNLPSIGYDWVSLGPGFEFGSRDHVSFFLHPAITYLHATAGNIQSVVGDSSSNLKIGDPSVNGWVVPTIRLGLTVLF